MRSYWKEGTKENIEHNTILLLNGTTIVPLSCLELQQQK